MRPASLKSPSARLTFTSQAEQEAMRGFAKLPWAFELNAGQTDPRVKFLARADGATVFLTRSEAVIAWKSGRNPSPARSSVNLENVLRFQFVGARQGAAISGEDELPGKTNYLISRDPRQWRTNIPHYAAVTYRELYPGVSVRFYGGQSGLEYDLTLTPGSDLPRVVLRAGDSSRLRLDSRGNLHVRVAGRDILMRRPEIYQLDHGRKVRVAGGYRLLGANSFGFRVGQHRDDLPLIIDPSISVTYTTFLGGNGAEKGNSVAVDSTGAVYVGGTTTLAPFSEPSPVVSPASLSPASGFGSATSVLFAAKVDTTQSGAASLVYLTFIGGTADNEGGKVAVDDSVSPPNLAILGCTTSADFPTLNAATSTPGGPVNLTISKLNSTGSGLVYSEYYGGSGSEATQGTGAIVTNATGGGIAADSAGDVFVTSDTTSTDLPQPATPNGFQQLFEGTGTAPTRTNNDGFLAKFGPSGNLLYSTYFGIAAMVGSTSVVVDAKGNAYVAGFTSSGSGFPSTNAFQASYGGGADDAFIMKINTNPGLLPPTTPVYASFLGGSGTDKAFAIALDNASPPNAYVTGTTQSSDFVSKTGLTNGFQQSLAGASNAFLAVISQAASPAALTYASYLGGSGADSGLGIVVNSSASPSQAVIAGSATSGDFPNLCSPQNLTGTGDVFVAAFIPTASGLSSLSYTALLGGSVSAEANALALDTSAPPHVIVFGDTLSSDYPLSTNGSTQFGFQPVCVSCVASLSDAFLTKIAISAAPIACVAFSLQGGPPAKFGSVAIGTSAVPVAVQLTNDGNSSLTLTGLTIVGANPSDFSVPSNTNSCVLNQAMPPSPMAGSSCSFEVDFTPSVVGQETATLQFTDDGAGSPQGLFLEGSGTSADVSLSQSSISFGNQAEGTTSNPTTVTLTNTGGNSLVINSVTLTGANTADFIFSGTNTCLSAAIVPSPGTCDLSVAFSPNEPNPPVSLSAQVNVSFTDQGTSVTATAIIPLSGAETSPAVPIVSIAPASLALNFNNETVGVTSGAQPVTITNTGSAALLFSSIGIGGTNSGDFNETNNCPIGGTTGLAVNANCTINVTFKPATTGPLSASLTVTDNATPNTQTVSLSGTGIAPGVSLSPSNLSFGSEDVGSASNSQQVTLTNSGNGPLTISGIGFTGSNPGDFSDSTNCPAPASTLAAGNSCDILVTFKPTATGSRSASLSVTDNATDSPQSVPASGTGTQPVVALSPSSGVAFPATLVGASSGASTLTLSNTGSGPLVVSSITFSGANPGDFSETDTCTGSANAVAPGGNCAINVNFVPTAMGSRSATLVLTDNASPSTQQTSVGGQATDFQLQPSGGSTSATITAGQTAIFPLQVSPENGFTGTVNFGCMNPPPKGTCTVSPPSVQLSGPTPVSFSVSVGTAANAFLLPRAPQTSPPLRAPRIPAFLWWIAALLSLLILWRARDGRRKLVPRFVLAFTVVLLASCSGGGSSNPGGNGTPPGTYTVTATGSVGSGAPRTLNLTVTVN